MSGIDPMTHPLPPREKVARALSPKCWEFYDRHVDDPRMAAEIKHEVAPSLQAVDAILTALASVSGDHAELARLAEAATPGEWELDGHQCLSAPDGTIVVDYSCHSRGEWEADAAYLRAVQPQRVLALLAENAALRAACDNANGHWKKTQAAWSEVLEATGCKDGGELVDKATRATEAERKLAEAVAVIERLGSSEAFDIPCVIDGPLAAEMRARMDYARTFLSKEAERG